MTIKPNLSAHRVDDIILGLKDLKPFSELVIQISRSCNQVLTMLAGFNYNGDGRPSSQTRTYLQTPLYDGRNESHNSQQRDSQIYQPDRSDVYKNPRQLHSQKYQQQDLSSPKTDPDSTFPVEKASSRQMVMETMAISRTMLGSWEPLEFQAEMHISFSPLTSIKLKQTKQATGPSRF